MDGYVTRSQFATIYGCSKPYVTKLVAERRLVLSADGKLINVEASLRLMNVTADPSKAGVRARWDAYRAGAALGATNTSAAGTNTPPAEGGTAAAAGGSPGSPASSTASSIASSIASSPATSTPADPPRSDAAKPVADESAYHQARTKREQAEAELATIELKKALGQLLDAPSTLRAFLDVQIAARTELLGLADRLTPLVTPEDDTRKVYDLIQAETERLCETIRHRIELLAAAAQLVPA